MVCQHQTKVEWETESEKQREQTKAIQKHKVIKVCALSDFYGVLQTFFYLYTFSRKNMLCTVLGFA